MTRIGRPRPAGTLRPAQVRFVEHYMVSLNATDAYRKVRPTVTYATARSEGHKTLTNPNVAAEIARRQALISERTNATVEKIVHRLWLLVQADPNELTSWRVGCCRNCHGVDHKPQRTDVEYATAKEYFDRVGSMPARPKHKGEKVADYARYLATLTEWDERGGPGFDPRRPAHDDCPVCMGEGQGRLVLGDTRRLSPMAEQLFAGVNQTKEGLEIVMHDKMAAIEKLMRHLGGYERDNKQKGAGEIGALLASFNGGVAMPIAPNLPETEI